MDAFLYIALGVVLTLALSWLIHRVWSFQAQSPDDYAGQEPKFDLRRHLDGPIDCEGVIYGPTGRVSSRFVAEMQADWTGRTGTMTERFRYDNGSVQDRSWSLSLTDDGKIYAEAEDLVGPGHGRQTGASVMLRYRLRLPKSAGGYVLDTTDWMYLMENGTIINRSEFRKFGIKVAELVATLRPVARADANRVAAE